MMLALLTETTHCIDFVQTFLIFGDSWWVFLNSTSRKTKTKHLKAQRSLSSVQQNQQVIEFRALHVLS